MTVCVDGKSVGGQIRIFKRILIVMITAEDVKRSPPLIMVCGYPENAVLQIVIRSRAFDCDVIALCAVFRVSFIALVCFYNKMRATVADFPMSDALPPVKRSDIIKVIDHCGIISVCSDLCGHSDGIPNSR